MMSHMTGLGWVMSCFIRRVICPGSYLPVRMSSNSLSDCSIGFARSFESLRGPCSFPPRCSWIPAAAGKFLAHSCARRKKVRTRVIRSVGQPALDEVDGEVEELLEVVARVGDLVRLIAKPADSLKDFVEVDLLLGLGVRVVEAEVAVASMILGVAKVDGDGLRMTDLAG